VDTPDRAHRTAAGPHRPQDADLGHIVIDHHQETTLRWVLEPTDHSLKTARAAGFRTRAGFADHWMCQHGQDWPPTIEELCARCAGEAVLPDGDVCPDCDLGTIDQPADLDDDTVLTEFAPHANTRVHVVHFHPVADDRPRFLSLAARPAATTPATPSAPTHSRPAPPSRTTSRSSSAAPPRSATRSSGASAGEHGRDRRLETAGRRMSVRAGTVESRSPPVRTKPTS
jgi:hypothetical protein